MIREVFGNHDKTACRERMRLFFLPQFRIDEMMKCGFSSLEEPERRMGRMQPRPERKEYEGGGTCSVE